MGHIATNAGSVARPDGRSRCTVHGRMSIGMVPHRYALPAGLMGSRDARGRARWGLRCRTRRFFRLTMCVSSEVGLHVMGIQLPIVPGMPVKVSAWTGRRLLKSSAVFRAGISLRGRPGQSRDSVVDAARNGNSARPCAGSASNRRSAAKKRRNRGSCSAAWNMTAKSELWRRCRQRRNSARCATKGC